MTKKYKLSWETFSDHLPLMIKEVYEEEGHSEFNKVAKDLEVKDEEKERLPVRRSVGECSQPDPSC